MSEAQRPALANEDRIPHERAVWRDGRPADLIAGSVRICVDYGAGLIEQTNIDQAAWARAHRWRFGWPPA